MAIVAFSPPAIHRSAENLQAEVIKPGDMSAEELAAWADMRSADPTFKSPLLSPDFALAVGRTRPDTRVAVFRRDQKLVGFLPFQSRPRGRARPLGAPFSDLHALITAADTQIEPADAMKAAGISSFQFDGLVDPFAIFSEETADTTPAFVLKVEDDPQAVLARLAERSPKRFKQYRRLERKLEREVGPIELTIGDGDRETFDGLLAWKRTQYDKNGLHDVLGPLWVREMMDNLFQQRGAVALQGCMVTLRAGGQTIAAEFGPREGGAFHPWISAYNPEMSIYSPGMLLMLHLIEAMPAAGLDTYDLGPSAENYKPYFASEVRQVASGSIGQNAGFTQNLIESLPDQRLRTIAERVLRRMDHVAATELTVLGRARGMLRAFASVRTRLDAEPKAQAKEEPGLA